jgi:quercetin dioxygenase-like cupin family protein
MDIMQHPTAKNPAAWFTGDVWLDPIAAPTQPDQQANAGIVRFAPGARTAWHSHPGGQTLHVTEGVALVQARGGDVVEVHAGSTAICPPGEEHWHGAAPDSFMTHIAVWDTLNDQPSAIWGAHVTDAAYLAERPA